MSLSDMPTDLAVPPYLLHPLIPTISSGDVSCAQALGSEVYVGCTNGELLRYALQVEPDSTKQESYSLLSRQSLPNGKPIDELVLIPYMSRVLILSDRQIHFYTLPSLDPVPNIKPIRHVETFAVDQQHLSRAMPAVHDILQPVDFSVIKRNSITLHSLYEERLVYSREIPFQPGALLARRAGQYLCVADSQYYNVVDLHTAQMFPVIPVNQATDDLTPVKPFIVVVGENEFLLLSWTGGSTLGVFVTGEGDPVRGTLEWPSHPLSVCLDYPNITTLLSNGTIEIHSVETQSIIQVVSPPPDGDTVADQRIGLVASLGGYIVPFSEHSEKMRKTTLRFDRN
ncbi:hypothetical protein EV363DRAFT_1317857 [Boletus edulis]|uniref:CNH domain-containing protein n=1 Tax=Boletus edulis BED1 TaxID=1328754 RepID=A0AAD4BSH3_BOLED|nr:hypothetical protein EV363DRAFT_1317857 [Boletus edulis]KAF8438201.1 hypothetical protein L210DRAFT_3545689 [Boletus edulis BED1]